MSFLALIAHNVSTKKVRSALTAIAVSLGIMTVIALSLLTHSLRQTAVSVLRTGTADFTVAQKGVSDVLYSALDESELERIRSHAEVESAVGVLVAPVELDRDHPFFLEIGIQPDELDEFGVRVVAGRAYDPRAKDEIMLGFRAARDLDRGVDDTIVVDTHPYRVVGIFSTGQVYGDSASMLPLPTLQAIERKPGDVTLAFVRVRKGAKIDPVRTAVEKASPQLATVRTQSEFGRVDRNLALINAANVGGSVLALVIGAVGVMNTMMLSFFERTREFGVLRAIGWSRRRVLTLVLGEAGLISLGGAMLGVLLGVVAVNLLQHAPQLVGVFEPDYSAAIFWRGLYIAGGMAFLGALYPATRAALLVPLEALRHE